MTENIDVYKNQIILARNEIKKLREKFSSLKQEHQKEIKHVKSILNNLRCSTCAAKATTIVCENDIGQATASNSTSISFLPIGYIETTFNNKRGLPRQPSVLNNAKGCLIIDTNVFNNPEHALSGLEEFSHIWIIFNFHMTESTNVPAKVSPPRLGGERCGVFSTRSPHRPCRIGLSLVKIHSIQGNKVYFNGVDMVNGTPVLDIKPYIPQYDYPQTYRQELSDSERPPTEGTNDAVNTMANLRIDDGISTRSLSPLGINTSSPLSSSTDIHSPGVELATPITPTESPQDEDFVDGPISSPIRRVDSERGAPDGQERFTPPQNSFNVNRDSIRVASWVNSPPSLKYQVAFTEDSLNRLNGLIGGRAASFKASIESLLSEDPRSVYVRTRYPNHEYSCVLEDLSVSCVFNESSCVCTITAVRSAEDLQN